MCVQVEGKVGLIFWKVIYDLTLVAAALKEPLLVLGTRQLFMT